MTDKTYQVVRYVSECDTVPVNNPSSLVDCLQVMRQKIHEIDNLDLIHVTSGRLVSWSLG